jgi:hypothetical protein
MGILAPIVAEVFEAELVDAEPSELERRVLADLSLPA